MRILIVSHYALPHAGGIEIIVDALSRELARRGHEVVHLASGAPTDPLTDSYRVVRIPAANFLERQFGVPYPLFHPKLVSALRREVAWADVVHCHGLLYMNCVGALVAARTHERPIRVVTEHVGRVHYDSNVLDWSQTLALRSFGRLSARLAEAIVVVNARVAREVGALAPEARIATIGYGVDIDRYRPARPGEREELRRDLGWDDTPRVLFVGRLVAKKGIHLALAAAVAARGAFRLVVIGRGALRARPPASVEVLGELSPERVAALYRAADAFLLPSHGEGFPLTAQEAMASGLPVVLGADRAYEPYVAGAGAGVRMVPLEGEAIAVAVQALLRDSTSRLLRGAEVAEYARAAFSWARVADAHEQLYDELLQART